MRSPLAAALMLVSILSPHVAAAERPKSETVTVGPWEIESVYRGQKFERCVMSRTTPDDVEVRFVLDADGLDMTMSAARWKLGRGKSYPVKLVAGNATLKADVAASGNAVRLPIKDETFLRALKLADGLDMKGEGSTIEVSLDKSAAGFERLEDCYEKNAEATDTNPFKAPPKKP